jgi:hypothetical protein
MDILTQLARSVTYEKLTKQYRDSASFLLDNGDGRAFGTTVIRYIQEQHPEHIGLARTMLHVLTDCGRAYVDHKNAGLHKALATAYDLPSDCRVTSSITPVPSPFASAYELIEALDLWPALTTMLVWCKRLNELDKANSKLL